MKSKPKPICEPNDRAFPAGQSSFGLTKREYIAALICANYPFGVNRPEVRATDSVKIADALIDELNK